MKIVGATGRRFVGVRVGKFFCRFVGVKVGVANLSSMQIVGVTGFRSMKTVAVTGLGVA